MKALKADMARIREEHGLPHAPAESCDVCTALDFVDRLERKILELTDTADCLRGYLFAERAKARRLEEAAS